MSLAQVRVRIPPVSGASLATKMSLPPWLVSLTAEPLFGLKLLFCEAVELELPQLPVTTRLPPPSSATPVAESPPSLPMPPAQTVPPPAFNFHTKVSSSVLVQLVSDLVPNVSVPWYAPVT